MEAGIKYCKDGGLIIEEGKRRGERRREGRRGRKGMNKTEWGDKRSEGT